MVLTGDVAASFDAAAAVAVRSSVASDAGVPLEAVDLRLHFPVYMAVQLGGVGVWTDALAHTLAGALADLNGISVDRVEVAPGGGSGSSMSTALVLGSAAGFDMSLVYSAGDRRLLQATLRVPIAVTGSTTGDEASALAEGLLGAAQGPLASELIARSPGFPAGLTVSIAPEDEPVVAVDLAVVVHLADSEAAAVAAAKLQAADGSAQIKHTLNALGLDGAFTALEVALPSPSPPPTPPPTPQPPPEPPLPRGADGDARDRSLSPPLPRGAPPLPRAPAPLAPMFHPDGKDGTPGTALTTPVLAALGVSAAFAVTALALAVLRLAWQKKKRAKTKPIGSSRSSKQGSAAPANVRDLVKRIGEAANHRRNDSSRGTDNQEDDGYDPHPKKRVAAHMPVPRQGEDENANFFLQGGQYQMRAYQPARAALRNARGKHQQMSPLPPKEARRGAARPHPPQGLAADQQVLRRPPTLRLKKKKRQQVSSPDDVEKAKSKMPPHRQ